MIRNIGKRRLISIGLIALVMWGWGELYHRTNAYFIERCPLTADASSGHVYPYQIHGGYLYLTSDQKHISQLVDVMWLATSVGVPLALKRIQRIDL
jgi:hypothetical protein